MGEATTEPCVTTRHAINLPGGRLDYQAQAGTVRVGRDDRHQMVKPSDTRWGLGLGTLLP